MEEEIENLNNKSKKRGGARPGAGRPIGSLSEEGLEKQRVFHEVKQRIMQKAQRLLDAQISIAQGQQFLYKIEKTKVVGPKGGISYRSEKPKLVTNEWEIQAYLDDLVDEENGEGEPAEAQDTYYFITTKEPVNQAIDSMFDRTFDKARQITDITTKGESINLTPEAVDKAKAFEEWYKKLQISKT